MVSVKEPPRGVVEPESEPAAVPVCANVFGVEVVVESSLPVPKVVVTVTVFPFNSVVVYVKVVTDGLITVEL